MRHNCIGMLAVYLMYTEVHSQHRTSEIRKRMKRTHAAIPVKPDGAAEIHDAMSDAIAVGRGLECVGTSPPSDGVELTTKAAAEKTADGTSGEWARIQA